MSPPTKAAAPSSPCIKLCWLDPVTGLCEGCGRTGAEIAAWPTLDEPARRALMALLPARLAASRGPTAPAAAPTVKRRP